MLEPSGNQFMVDILIRSFFFLTYTYIFLFANLFFFIFSRCWHSVNIIRASQTLYILNLYCKCRKWAKLTFPSIPFGAGVKTFGQFMEFIGWLALVKSWNGSRKRGDRIRVSIKPNRFGHFTTCLSQVFDQKKNFYQLLAKQTKRGNRSTEGNKKRQSPKWGSYKENIMGKKQREWKAA